MMTRYYLPKCNVLPVFSLHDWKVGMPFKTFSTVLKKCKSSDVSGGGPLQTFELLKRPPPLSTPKSMAYVMGCMGTSMTVSFCQNL